jgi:hypothetical protein
MADASVFKIRPKCRGNSITPGILGQNIEFAGQA